VTCLVVVTGLVATGGAHLLDLDLLGGRGGELLAQRLGTGRVAAEPDAVEEIITRCARLPSPWPWSPSGRSSPACRVGGTGLRVRRGAAGRPAAAGGV
jgi:hypothetical protein